MTLADFIDACRRLARFRGDIDRSLAGFAQITWGLNPDRAMCYSDPDVAVVAEAEPSLAILVIRRSNNNPVICTKPDGNPYRRHGEWAYLADHVAALVER